MAQHVKRTNIQFLKKPKKKRPTNKQINTFIQRDLLNKKKQKEKIERWKKWDQGWQGVFH